MNSKKYVEYIENNYLLIFLFPINGFTIKESNDNNSNELIYISKIKNKLNNIWGLIVFV